MKSLFLFSFLIFSSAVHARPIFQTAGLANYKNGYKGSINCELAHSDASSKSASTCLQYGKKVAEIVYSDCYVYSWQEASRPIMNAEDSFLGYTGTGVAIKKVLRVDAQFTCK